MVEAMLIVTYGNLAIITTSKAVVSALFDEFLPDAVSMLGINDK